MSLSDLASGYFSDHEYDLALECYQQLYDQTSERLGVNHPNTILSLNNLAMTHQANYDVDLARPMFEKALTPDEAISSRESP